MKWLKWTLLILGLALFGWLGYEIFTSTPLGDARHRLKDLELATSSSDIALHAPDSGEVVSSPFMISGSAYSADSFLYWWVKDEEGVVRKDGVIDLGTSDAWADFEQEIFLPEIPDHLFTLELFTKDEFNLRVATLEQGLLFGTTEVFDLQVFYIDVAKLDVEAGICAPLAYQSRGVAMTDAVERIALEELFRGPTADWAQHAVPESAELLSLNREGGVVHLHFTKSTAEDWFMGECSVSAGFEQISQTLEQFEGVESVKIWLNEVELSSSR